MESRRCSLLEMYALFGKKWSFLIVQEVYHVKKIGFNELKKRLIHITNRILSERLSDLEKMDIIEKKIIQKKPLRVEYVPTESGKELFAILQQFKKWGIHYGSLREDCSERNCVDCFFSPKKYRNLFK